MDSPHAITLRIKVKPNANIDYITDTLGECARDLEATESSESSPQHLGLVPDENDPGRYAWEVVAESYTP